MKYDLDPVDWLLNPWHPHEPWQKPAPRKFKAEKVAKLGEAWWNRKGPWSWSKAGLAADAGFDEALVIWNALRQQKPSAPLQDFATALILAPRSQFGEVGVFTLLAKLYPVDCLADWVLAAVRNSNDSTYDDTFRRAVLPYLTADERTVLREAAARQVRESSTPNDLALMLSGLLGACEEVDQYLQLPTPCHLTPDRAAMLGLPTQRVRHWHPELAPGMHVDHILGLIAHTGLDYLEAIIAPMARVGFRERAYVEALTGAVRDAGAAPLLFPILENPKLAPVVTAWFEQHGAEAAAALQRHPWRTTGQKGRKQREAALLFADSLLQQARPTACVPAVVDFGLEASLKAPAWISPAALPAIEIHDTGGSLDEQSTRDLLALLAAMPPLQEPPTIADLKRKATPESLDRWALELLEAWRRDGMKPKERWALASTGVLGGPLCMSRLAANVTSWTAGSRYDTARLAYQCLLKNGSAEALWSVCDLALNGVSMANAMLKEEAGRRGLSADELCEIAMPRYGFDQRGEQTLQLGSRTLRLKATGQELRIFDESGSVLETLPKPRNADDADQQVVADFRALRLAYDRGIRRETKRFQGASVYRREYSRRHLEECILPHPVMGPLARRLVWGAFGFFGERLTAFLIDESGGLTGIDHGGIEWPPGLAFVSLLRAADLDAESRAAWTGLLAEYEIVQPFPQFCAESEVFSAGYSEGISTVAMCEPFLLGPFIKGLTKACVIGQPAASLDLRRLLSWQQEMDRKARHGGGAMRRPLRPGEFREELRDCGFEVDDQRARKLLGGGIEADLDYADLSPLGVLWRLRLKDSTGNLVQGPTGISEHSLDVLRDDFRKLGLIA